MVVVCRLPRAPLQAGALLTACCDKGLHQWLANVVFSSTASAAPVAGAPTMPTHLCPHPPLCSTAGASTARASAPRCRPRCCAAALQVSGCLFALLPSPACALNQPGVLSQPACVQVLVALLRELLPSGPPCTPPCPACSVCAAVRGAGWLCVGVARLGGAHAAAANLHAAARGLPHPRRCAAGFGGPAVGCRLPGVQGLKPTACSRPLAWHSTAACCCTPPAHPASSVRPAPAEIEVEVPVEHGLLVENLLDLVRPLASWISGKQNEVGTGAWPSASSFGNQFCIQAASLLLLSDFNSPRSGAGPRALHAHHHLCPRLAGECRLQCSGPPAMHTLLTLTHGPVPWPTDQTFSLLPFSLSPGA